MEEEEYIFPWDTKTNPLKIHPQIYRPPTEHTEVCVKTERLPSFLLDKAVYNGTSGDALDHYSNSGDHAALSGVLAKNTFGSTSQ